MSIWLDGYVKNMPSGHIGHAPRVPGPPRIVLHTTETAFLPNYDWPPHFTVGVVDPQSLSSYYGPPGTVRKWQHCDLALTSYALVGNTNSDGDHCVQIEVVTYSSKNRGDWPEALREAVAHVLADIVIAIPEMAPCLDRWPALWSRYSTSKTRMSLDEWQKGIDGLPFICGHEHVPGNLHWDPADPNILDLVTRARTLLGTTPIPDADWPTLLRPGDRHAKVSVLKGLLTALDYHEKGMGIGDSYNVATVAAVKRFQSDHDLVADGIVGKATRISIYNAVSATA